MALSKRLALLGAQSALSVAKPRGHGSSYNLIHCRQVSKVTKQSKSSQAVDDSKLEIEKLQGRSSMLHDKNRSGCDHLNITDLLTYRKLRKNSLLLEMFFSNHGRHRYVFRVQLETVNEKEFSIFSLPAIFCMSIIIAAIISHELDLQEARRTHELNQIVEEKDLRYKQLEKQNEETRQSLILLQDFMEKHFPGSFPTSA